MSHLSQVKASSDPTPPASSILPWTHAEAPGEHEINVLCNEYGLTKRLLLDALDQDEIPRIEQDRHYTYIITRFAYQTSSGTISTAPMLFAISGKRLITVTSQHLPGIETILPGGNRVKTHTDPVLYMLQLLLQIDAQYDLLINHSSRTIRRLRDQLDRREVNPHDLVQFVHIEDDMNDFLSSLEPTNATLRHLLTNTVLPDFSNHKNIVNVVLLNNEQSIRICNANLKTIDAIRRTYTLISSYHLDRSIKTLTLASLFIAIPTMFFSMYGMNVSLPHQRHPFIFIGLMLLCIISGAAAYLVGRKKRVF
jgi:magnesium transporter